MFRVYTTCFGFGFYYFYRFHFQFPRHDSRTTSDPILHEWQHRYSSRVHVSRQTDYLLACLPANGSVTDQHLHMRMQNMNISEHRLEYILKFGSVHLYIFALKLQRDVSMSVRPSVCPSVL